MVPKVDLPLHDNKCDLWNHFEMAISYAYFMYFDYIADIQYTADREIFVLKIFRALKFHGAKFS